MLVYVYINIYQVFQGSGSASHYYTGHILRAHVDIMIFHGLLCDFIGCYDLFIETDENVYAYSCFNARRVMGWTATQAARRPKTLVDLP